MSISIERVEAMIAASNPFPDEMGTFYEKAGFRPVFESVADAMRLGTNMALVIQEVESAWRRCISRNYRAGAAFSQYHDTVRNMLWDVMLAYDERLQ